MKDFQLVFILCISSFFSSLQAQQGLNISSYIQGQYQYGQPDASLKVGDTNENPDKGFNRIGIRRGRVKAEYNDGIGTGAVQIEANDKGVSFRDLYIGIKDPWNKRSRLMMGLFNRPFGYEISYSSSALESVERAIIIQYFFPDERDLGAMLSLRADASAPLNFLRLDAGVFAGNSINRETDNRKDFIGRIGAEKEIKDRGKWGLGVSYYNGSVYNPTAEAYEMRDNRFVRIEKATTGSFMKREYLGFDGQLSLYSPAGTTTLRAEGLLGVQPGIAGSSKSPNYSSRPENIPANALYKRPFFGCFFYIIQDVGQSPFSLVVKYDSYDPNTKVKGNEAGTPGSYTTQTDLRQSAIGLCLLYRYSKHIRLQACYEINKNEKSSLVKGYETDRKDNVFTLRVQYRF
ncbi:MAG: OprO/OprP family phosphate-selective porin [Tannerellaceae bacterium]|jgi:phosphate-selective porin|nr:OprO/OprP family phosphate-selective porin [Tannerellaceae bacterium]